MSLENQHLFLSGWRCHIGWRWGCGLGDDYLVPSIRYISCVPSYCFFLTTLGSSLMVFCWACPLIPTSNSSPVVQLATIPLQPTSTERIFLSQPRSLASSAKLTYHSFLLWKASLMASSQGIVSSTMKTWRQDLDQSTKSGRRLVAAISGLPSFPCVKWAWFWWNGLPFLPIPNEKG